MDSHPAWVFGYGSLIWRAGFEHEAVRTARVDGLARRFWQGSTDHRGRPGAPGRVVTLIEAPDAVCWGRAYRLDPVRRPAIIEALDRREIGGYDRVALDITLEDGSLAPAVTWVAWPDNPNYLGAAPLQAIATQVLQAVGPSGPNPDYVLNLDEALRSLGVRDTHVFNLARAVRELQRAPQSQSAP